MTITPTPQQVLDLRMQPNDADAATIRDYLIKLLHLVWEDREGFDGKRPFGNSGWAWDVYGDLIRAGYVPGSFDEDGDVEVFDDDAQVIADQLITDAINHLGRNDSVEG